MSECPKVSARHTWIKIYFVDPYSAWQRGTNKNSNELLREFYPKEIDIAKVDEINLQDNIDLINSRPRKVLGLKSVSVLYMEELLHLIWQTGF